MPNRYSEVVASLSARHINCSSAVASTPELVSRWLEIKTWDFFPLSGTRLSGFENCSNLHLTTTVTAEILAAPADHISDLCKRDNVIGGGACKKKASHDLSEVSHINLRWLSIRVAKSMHITCGLMFEFRRNRPMAKMARAHLAPKNCNLPFLCQLFSRTNLNVCIFFLAV